MHVIVKRGNQRKRETEKAKVEKDNNILEGPGIINSLTWTCQWNHIKTLGQRSGSGCKSQFNFKPNQDRQSHQPNATGQSLSKFWHKHIAIIC